MNAAVPVEWLATAMDDLQSPLYTRMLLKTHVKMRRHIEECWGLHHGEFYEDSPLNTIKIRPSISRIFSRCALVPTEEILNAMLRMQKHNLACPFNQRKRYDEEFPAREYHYMLVPVDELPPLVIAPPGCKPSPLTFTPGQFPIVTSTTNPWYLCNHAARGVNSWDPVNKLPWARTLFALTDAWKRYDATSFLDTPRLYPPRHADSLPDESDHELEDDDSSSDISTPDEDSIDYGSFQSWAARCASASNCTDTLPSPMDEDIDESEFIHTMQRPPAWCLDSQKGNQWLQYLLEAPAS